MRAIRFLHIASFTGNIGDNISHLGFRAWLKGLSKLDLTFIDLEIRQFFWKQSHWDDDLVRYVNSFDAVIIGGGNYFELWDSASPTGTSIGIPQYLWSRISVPVFFNALGLDPNQGASPMAVKRFRSFLDYILGRPDWLVSLRNDGAISNLTSLFGGVYYQRVHEAPDNAFHARSISTECSAIPEYRQRSSCQYLAINVACDMAARRYAGYASGYQGFAEEFSSSLASITELHPELRLVFVPHIYSDLRAISDIIECMPDQLRRQRVDVACYGSGDNAALATMRTYAGAVMSLSMRFHANIIPIIGGVEVLGLACYPQITDFYRCIDMSDRCISVSAPGFREEVVAKSTSILSGNAHASLTPQVQALRRAKQLADKLTPFVLDWLKLIDIAVA